MPDPADQAAAELRRRADATVHSVGCTCATCDTNNLIATVLEDRDNRRR